MCSLPSIDMEATGTNIVRMRRQHGMTVQDPVRFPFFRTKHAADRRVLPENQRFLCILYSGIIRAIRKSGYPPVKNSRCYFPHPVLFFRIGSRYPVYVQEPAGCERRIGR